MTVAVMAKPSMPPYLHTFDTRATARGFILWATLTNMIYRVWT
jgi:hypothetical protein